MDLFVQFMERLLDAVLQLVMNPFYYIGIVFIILQYRKQVQLERKLFHTKLHSLLNETWRTVLWGWIGGLLASVLMLFIGVTVQADAVLLLWGITVILLMIRVRFLCLAYAVGILGIAHAIIGWLPNIDSLQKALPLLKIIMNADIPSLLAIVAVLHLVEGLLVGLQGSRMASPLFLEGKRGKIIGGYQLQGFWPVPLFLLVPLAGGGASGLPWATLFGANLAAGWTLLAFPAMIGFTELTVSKLPKKQTRHSSNLLYLYGAILLGAAAAAHFWTPFIIVAALLSIALHEALMAYNRIAESRQTPCFVHSDLGLTVLAVVPGSPAEAMGIQIGEKIYKVNGHRVASKTDIHAAMQLNAAFCKLEVLDDRGEVRFLQRAIYAGDHHQLGIILAPDQHALYYLEQKPLHLFSYLRSKLTGVLSNNEASKSKTL